MKYPKILVCCGLILSGGIQILSGQSTNQNIPGMVDKRLTAEQNQQRDLDRRRAEMRSLTIRPGRRAGTNSSENKPLTKEEREKIKKLSEPHPEDLKKYEAFLNQSDTGIFRLYPDFDCEDKHIVRVDGKCLNFVPGMWSYSFRQNERSDKNFQDISYKEDFFETGGFLNQGILVSLDNAQIGNVSLTSDGMKYLVDFKPQTEPEKIRKQYQALSKGIEYDGFNYSDKIKVEENKTYALRVVAYKYKNKNANDPSDFRDAFEALSYDKRKDLIVAFQIIRKTDDGGLTVVWKKLQELKSPTIVFQKGDKLSDFKTMRD